MFNQELEEVKPQWRARLTDWLSPSSRAKRRTLLAVSSIYLITTLLGIRPSKIDALGLSLEFSGDEVLLNLLLLANIYLLIGFFIYAWADWKIKERINKASRSGYINEFVNGKATFIENILYSTRVAFDFYMPILYSALSTYKLFKFIENGPIEFWSKALFI